MSDHSPNLIKIVRLGFGLLSALMFRPKSALGAGVRIVKNIAKVIYGELVKLNRQHLYSDWQLGKLRDYSINLSSYLQNVRPLKFTIVIPTYQPRIEFFEQTVRSALEQGAQNFEVLIGFDGRHGAEYEEVVRRAEREIANTNREVKLFLFERPPTGGGGISETTNRLVENATGDYVVLLDHDDWIRPDLLCRYHQTLILFNEDTPTCLYCNEYKIDENGRSISGSFTDKPLKPEFPFVFINWICHALAIPRATWKQVGGLKREYDGSQDYDFCLRLDEAGCKFLNVPFHLYAWRVHGDSTAKNAQQKPQAHSAGVAALAASVKRRGLDWSVGDGLYPTSYRCIPNLNKVPKVHVVMPFKDQGDITIAAIRAVLKQSGVETFVTAVDNNSKDRTIQEKLQGLGVEVIQMPVPFNYSYLNNQALVESACPSNFELVLFLNNDVVLEVGAILEMARWLSHGGVGAVGARLRYPNGKIQHGGIYFNTKGAHEVTAWSYFGHLSKNDRVGMHSVIYTPDAVTAACLMTNRTVLKEVGGFDPYLYPIAYSDTNLCMKIRSKGYTIIYTPFAEGVHHESLSRGKQHIEDFESSTWLHANYFHRREGLKKGDATSHSQLWM